jgi:long-chain acyl-CoA synthetase
MSTSEIRTEKARTVVTRDLPEQGPRNLVELAEQSFQKHADRPLFGTKGGAGWRWTTFAEVQAAIDAFRAGLASLGVREGDRVAIVAENRLEWAVAAYATYGLGATFVAMYPQQRHDEWEFILHDCAAKVVIGSGEIVVDALEEMRPRLPALAHVVAIDASMNRRPTFDELVARGREHPVPAIHPRSDAVAALVYTSGTTGKPKGVMLTHGNIASNIESVLSIFPIYSEERLLSFLPWAHAYGQIELHVVLATGASTALVTDVTKLVEELAEVKPTVLVAVPRIFNKLYAGVSKQIAGRGKLIERLFQRAVATAAKRRRGEPTSLMEKVVLAVADRLIFSRIRERFGGRLKYVISASATLSLDVAEAIDAMGLQVYEGYGLTETAPIVSANTPGARKLGSVGRTIPGVKVVIDESGGDQPGRGEIIVYGPNVMRGYHERPEENAKAFTPDGGLRTGDIGYLDRDGFLFITGRIKEQYKLENGKYVMPSPLEEKLKLSPFILNTMLYGDNREYNVAIVAVDVNAVRGWAEENHLTLASDLAHDPRIQELVRAEIARLDDTFRSYEKPRDQLIITEDFTIESGLLTPSMKVKRKEVLNRYGAALEALYREPAHGRGDQI